MLGITISHTGQTAGITWNGKTVGNNSLVTLAVVLQRVSVVTTTLFPLVCEGITGGQWYQPNGALFPLATPDNTTIPQSWGQRNVSRGVELYRGTPYDFPHGVQCCTNTTITLCVGMYTDLTFAASSGIAASGNMGNTLSVAATCK